jgi:hypothetical protein
MFYNAPRFRLAPFELRLAAPHDFRFRRRQGIAGINPAFRFYEDAVLLLSERHKIPRLKLEGLEDIPRNHHLAALPHAAGSLLGCLHGIY